MKTYLITLFMLLGITSQVRAQSTIRSQSLGQGVYDARIQRIDGQVLAASAFPNVTYVLTYDDIPEQAFIPGTLETLVSTKEAIESGRPNAKTAGLLNNLLGGEHGFQFNEAKAELLSAFRDAGREYDVKHKSSVCVPFPRVMPELPGTEPQIAWAISFEFAAGMKDPSVFQVWATDHGALGKFSVGTWAPGAGEL